VSDQVLEAEARATQKYYEDLLKMFLTPGWKLFLNDMEESASVITLEAAKDADEFWRYKGKREVFNRLEGYEGFIKDGADESSV